MASILRQIVASPRARHAETGLDLCYISDNIIATSGPSSAWPKKAYRNPTDQLVKYLDYKHQDDWSIFEFRAEGTGYPDSEVYNRIQHFPWPDHHPPPFAIIPPLMSSMRGWLHPEATGEIEGKETSSSGGRKRVAVLHCKAGKGRSGTVACSYLITHDKWKREDALARFTERRMRIGFGHGVSIPSQLRWVRYVDQWANQLDKKYVDRPVEIVELHLWGVRDGITVGVDGYIENGRRMKTFHTFTRDETILTSVEPQPTPFKTPETSSESNGPSEASSITAAPTPSTSSSTSSASTSTTTPLVTGLLRPKFPLILPTSDINITVERRSKAAYTTWTMVTSVAHVWINAYFEGGHRGDDSGVFEIEWEAMDGIKGSARKGTKGFDRMKVVWRYAGRDGGGRDSIRPLELVKEPSTTGEVKEPEPGDLLAASSSTDEQQLTMPLHTKTTPVSAATRATESDPVLSQQSHIPKSPDETSSTDAVASSNPTFTSRNQDSEKSEATTSGPADLLESSKAGI